MRFLKMLLHSELDTSEWLNNILFGLIMVLTTTALMGMKPIPTPAAGVEAFDEEIDDNGDTPKSILLQVVGCNVAWGIINGGLLILDRLYQRGRTDRLLRSIQKAGSEAEALAVVEDDNEWDLDALTTPEAQQALYRNVLARAKDAPPSPTMRVCGQDVADAIVTGIVVAVTVLPVVLSVLLLANPQLSFKVGNGISLFIMFVVGYVWGRETGVKNPWIAAVIITLFGAVAVAVAWSMGG